MIQYLVLFIIVYHLFLKFKWSKIKPTFEGKTVLITGASSGIGEELAKQFVKLRASKVILASRRIPELQRVKDQCQIQFKNQEIEIAQMDLADPELCLAFAQKYGEIDILVNNGGIS